MDPRHGHQNCDKQHGQCHQKRARARMPISIVYANHVHPLLARSGSFSQTVLSGRFARAPLALRLPERIWSDAEKERAGIVGRS